MRGIAEVHSSPDPVCLHLEGPARVSKSRKKPKHQAINLGASTCRWWFGGPVSGSCEHAGEWRKKGCKSALNFLMCILPTGEHPGTAQGSGECWDFGQCNEA